MTKTRMIATAIGLGAFCAGAQAQFSAHVPPTPKAPAVTTASSQGGGFSMGVDACTTAHTSAGTGNVSGVPYTTGTTGTTGQAEGICLFFGFTGIDNDVWFDWTASLTGTATFDTCGNTQDTKVAVYPFTGASACPAANSSLACNDDSCGLQSAVSWSSTNGTSYTIQLGTFPGAAGGSGTFKINQTGPPPCGQKDDGTTENALGLVAGGEIGWMCRFATGPSTCLDKYDSVETAYGTLMFPGSVTNGSGACVTIYHDADLDNNPNTGLTVKVKVLTTVVNGDTDILNKIPLGASIVTLTDSNAWVLASADHVAGQFPAPMDQTPPTDALGTWVVGSTLGPGTLNTTNLSANDVPPTNMAAIGFPANWLLRLDNTTTGTGGIQVCFGDGSGTGCPCLNTGSAGHGCANGTGNGGILTSSGHASVTFDTFTLTADGVINNNGLFFQGNNTIAGGNGTVFGDGIRCCGGGVVRIQVVNPPGTTSPATAQMTETATTNGPPGTITPGTKKCYQFWYRDPATSPCGAQFNLTNAVSITWRP